MARFLFCPVPEAGDVYPTVPVALALRSRGHDVAYLTGPRFEKDFKHEGIRHYVHPRGVYGPEVRKSDSVHRRFGHLPEQVNALAPVFDDFRADVLVDGSFPLGPRLFAEMRGIPRASVHAGCYPIPPLPSRCSHTVPATFRLPMKRTVRWLGSRR